MYFPGAGLMMQHAHHFSTASGAAMQEYHSAILLS
jgi:hypothetical protein